MRRHRKQVDDIFKVELDLRNLDPTISVDHLREIALRNNVYLKYKQESGLSDEAWVRALSINMEREKSYSTFKALIPNMILNKARSVSIGIKRIVTTYHNQGL